MRFTLYSSSGLLALGLLLATSTVTAQESGTSILTVDEPLAETIDKMEVMIEFALGDILIERGNPSKAVTGYIKYDEKYITPRMFYDERGTTARFELKTKSRHEDWWDSATRNVKSPKSELYFTTRVPLDIDFSCGLGEAQLDLGDLQINDLSISNGLGETSLDFSTPNAADLRRLTVENGLGQLSAKNLSNARTDRMRFDCGLGETDLDFSGEKLRDMYVEVNVGLGSVVLRIPRGYNVEMKAEETFLSSVDTHGLVKEGRGRYRSRDHDPSKPTLRLKAAVGLGSIEIKWISND